MSLHVVVADDAPLIRQAIAAVLEAAGIVVVAEAGDGPGTLAEVERHRPDVVVLDVRMPPGYRAEGLQAALTLRATHPSVGLLLLSQSVQPAHLQQLVAAGAGGTGYLLKERAAGAVSFVEAVRTVAAGGCRFDPEVVAALVAPSHGVAGLSPRERQVLELMASGASNLALGERLGMGPKTVESHVRRIFQQLDLPDEPEVNRRVSAVLAYLRATGG